jgi:hypothetical protein
MVNADIRKCAARGCSKSATFGHPGGRRRALRCAAHKLDDMVSVRGQKCAELECSKFPSFGYPGRGKLLRCATHRLDGMVNLRCRKCAAPGCDTGASFGYLGGQRLRCVAHKLAGMVGLTHRRKKVRLEKAPPSGPIGVHKGPRRGGGRSRRALFSACAPQAPAPCAMEALCETAEKELDSFLA